MPTSPHEDRFPVVTYHSIGSAPGPTSIAAETFRMQMDVLVDCGYLSMNCQDFLDWRSGRKTDAAGRVLITFDDGFADFATTAFPILRERNLSCVVFVPTGKVGNHEDWRGANAPPRPLMSWSAVVELAQAGVEFGGHGISHVDLTRLTPEQRRHEINRCAQELAERTGRRTRSFAAPYGRVNQAVLADLAQTYDVAFGTRFDRARSTCELLDVPRIEMHYFRQRRQWQAFLRGDQSYFLVRRVLRACRNVATTLLG
jgi:peptidoglycan/xylan/chitin deacetylase (PgdA/CDA1 family)